MSSNAMAPVVMDPDQAELVPEFVLDARAAPGKLQPNNSAATPVGQSFLSAARKALPLSFLAELPDRGGSTGRIDVIAVPSNWPMTRSSKARSI